MKCHALQGHWVGKSRDSKEESGEEGQAIDVCHELLMLQR